MNLRFLNNFYTSKNLKAIIISIIVLAFNPLDAQTPNDELMMTNKQACILLMANTSKFNKYWEGNELRENQTIAQVNRLQLTSMMALGILDKLNVFVGLPYISTKSSEPNGGNFAGQHGFQDVTLDLKYKWLDKKVGSNTLKSLVNLGYATPLGNYSADYMPYSIGFGTDELTTRAILYFETKSRYYTRVGGTFTFKGYTKSDKDYYYSNGSIYSEWMDVPNSVSSDFVVGKWMFNNALQVEVNYFIQKSLSGDDIRAYNAPQPTNQINFDRIGIFTHYYSKHLQGLGLVASYSANTNGKNAPASKNFGLGLTYYFNYRN